MKQKKQGEFKQTIVLKNNLHTNNKTKGEIYYFIAGPGIEADTEVVSEEKNKESTQQI